MFGCGESLMFKVQSEITNLNIKNYIYIYICIIKFVQYNICFCC